jgi:hypothetical protein
MNIKNGYCFTHRQALQFLAALVLISHGLVSFAGNENAWDSAYDVQVKARYIPVELWTGGKWDGTRELKMRPADIQFGGHKHIIGPITYTRPNTSDSILVYKRTNRDKSQLFTLSSRGDGLGRVFDSRYGRDCNDEVKMPLGLWHEDETRLFKVECNQGALVRKIEVTIEKLDFEYSGVPHSLEFHWVVDGGRERGTDMHYIYSPGRGLVYEFGNE